MPVREAQVDFARIRQELTAALGRLNLTELFNRQQGQDGEAVQDPAAYFEDADLADLDLLDLGGVCFLWRCVFLFRIVRLSHGCSYISYWACSNRRTQIKAKTMLEAMMLDEPKVK